MTNLETELVELRQKIKSVAEDQDDHRRTLMPVWHREDQLKKAIRATHGQKPTGVWYDGEQLMALIFDRSRAGERKPLYDELQEIAERYGRVKEAWKELGKRLKGYQREAKTIERELAQLAAKRRPLDGRPGPAA